MPFPYTPPITEINFVLNRLIGLEKLSTLPGYESVSEDLVSAVLEEAGKIASNVFAPINDTCDKEGVKFENNKVTMPKGCKEAYKLFIDGGWNGIQVPEHHGGQGLPALIGISIAEMLQAANTALALCPMLNNGAIELLSEHGGQELQDKYLAKLVSGEWAGTMDITEPQAGSDVGEIKAKAVKDGDHYLISGQKIFISFGEHDMTENIIHMVLARLPDAPKGTKGLSLFLVPRFLVNDDGSIGDDNEVKTVSIEHKLGQHASPTCVMVYGEDKGSVGYLVGKENGGIAAMFTMMNNARMNVGVQGLGILERAYQHARDYAKFRVQGKLLDKSKEGNVTIINHPDVKRMLLEIKSHTEAARALAYHCAVASDLAKHSTDEKIKEEAKARASLLIPVVKAWITNNASKMASEEIQIFGGVGYIEESGTPQHFRDARVLEIYEGTNGIQANDLVFRKLLGDQGAEFRAMTNELEEFIKNWNKSLPAELNVIRDNLSNAFLALIDAAVWILGKGKEATAEIEASAVEFLKLFGNVLGGYYLAKSAVLAHEDIEKGVGDKTFLESKILTAKFYATHALEDCVSIGKIVRTGADTVTSADESMFV
ncbi:MAG: acyl-CoA dehydrogenase [Alphaproteobacteria bacterium]|nr:acyl-CoA dehydrogenase [Alphaproteobacteria bacterium]